MEKLTLLMLFSWYDECDIGPFYCPDCGIIEGFFAYNPGIKEKLEVIYVDFKRPRLKIIELLGEENQGSPVLVVDNSNQMPAGGKKSMSTGRIFIDDPLMICEYLGKLFKGVRPH